MGLETRINLTARDEAAALNAFNTTRDQFAREYARGQNMFVGLRDTFSQRQDQTGEIGLDLIGRTHRLAEFRGRRQTPAATPNYLADLSTNTAAAHQALNSEVTTAVAETTTQTGFLGGAYREGWLQTDGLRLTAGALAALAGYYGYQGVDQVLAYDAALVLGAPGLIDVARRVGLETTTRFVANLGTNTAEMVRRRASIAEGNATGDFPVDGIVLPQPNPETEINNSMRDAEANQLTEQLETDGINPPPAVINNTTWAPGLRESMERALSRFDFTDSLITARDVARRSRLWRTAFAALVVAGGMYANHFLRPAPEVPPTPYCGIRTFPVDDPRFGPMTGNGENHSIKGIMQEYAFNELTGRNFNPDNPKDVDAMNDFYTLDPEGNEAILAELKRRFITKNGHLIFTGTDTFRAGLVLELCRSEIQEGIRAVALRSARQLP